MKARCALSVVSLIMASAISAWVLSSFSFGADFKPRELLTNGNFESGDKASKDWTIGPGVSWEKEDGNRFLRLRASSPVQARLPAATCASSRTGVSCASPAACAIAISCAASKAGTTGGSR